MWITPDLKTANTSLYLEEHSMIPQHSDNEKLFDSYSITPYNQRTIMSISYGATRIFAFRNKLTNEEIHIALENGDVLHMEGACQDTMTHEVFPQPRTQ